LTAAQHGAEARVLLGVGDLIEEPIARVHLLATGAGRMGEEEVEQTLAAFGARVVKYARGLRDAQTLALE
jgi:hypothetical protein